MKKVKKMFSHLAMLIISISLLTYSPLTSAQDASTGLLDDSLQDLTVVFGAGAVGAILGLSTLSFADKPKDELKNVAIGGAVGIVVGVGIVIFSQASKSQSSITLSSNSREMSPESSEKIAKLEFSKQKIAEQYFMTPTVGYSFQF